MKKILRYEARRIAAQKKWFLIALGLIAAFFIVVAIVYFSMPTLASEEGDVAALTAKYEESIAWNENFLAQNGGGLRPDQVEGIKQNIARYRFFLDSGTTENDYFELGQYMGKYKHYELFGLTFTLCEFSLYLFLITAVFCALWAFAFEGENGLIKNLLQSTDRKSLFRAKLVSSAGLTAFLPVIAFLFELLVLACCKKRAFLVFDGEYVVMNAFELLCQINLRNIILVAFTYAATLLCATFFKPLTSGLAVPLSYLFIAFVAMIVTNKSNFVLLNIRGFEVFNLFPVIGFLNYAGGFDLAFILPAIAHAAACVLLVVCARIKFCKKDF